MAETLTQDPKVITSESRIEGVVIGLFAGFAESGEPLVDYPGNPLGRPLTARSTAVLDDKDSGREAALLFERGDPSRPILVGLIQEPRLSQGKIEAQVDEEVLTFTANKQIVLKCGKASITLTRAGKVLIRGAYLSSRSSGVNRIKGGSIQLN